MPNAANSPYIGALNRVYNHERCALCTDFKSWFRIKSKMKKSGIFFPHVCVKVVSELQRENKIDTVCPEPVISVSALVLSLKTDPAALAAHWTWLASHVYIKSLLAFRLHHITSVYQLLGGNKLFKALLVDFFFFSSIILTESFKANGRKMSLRLNELLLCCRGLDNDKATERKVLRSLFSLLKPVNWLILWPLLLLRKKCKAVHVRIIEPR